MKQLNSATKEYLCFFSSLFLFLVVAGVWSCLLTNYVGPVTEWGHFVLLLLILLLFIALPLAVIAYLTSKVSGKIFAVLLFLCAVQPLPEMIQIYRTEKVSHSTERTTTESHLQKAVKDNNWRPR